MTKYIITSIVHADTGEARTDGRYPTRTGSTVELCFVPVVGKSMCLSYVSDNLGNEKYGTLVTSTVNKIVVLEKEVIVTTKNSIYTLSLVG